MPYTPPSASPNVSRTSSRSSSISLASPPPSTTFGELSAGSSARSASYLQKHRRPQLTKNGSAFNNEPAHPAFSSSSSSTPGPPLNPPRSSSSLHQSPSPVSNASMIPTGAIISPPDSSQNSSDDESSGHGRGRKDKQSADMAQLSLAIAQLNPNHKSASPERSPPPEYVPTPEQKSPEMLSAAIHDRMSALTSHHHHRSQSDNFPRDFAARQQQHHMDDDDDSGSDEDENFIAPAMVRKKSGELVKSSLKTPLFRRRPSSMPSTPTYPKAVHFDQHLEHVRHFEKSEKPLAVSAGSSPVESSIEYDSEYPFPTMDYSQPPFEWEIGLPNFPERLDRSGLPVRVERVVLSHDNKSILGTVACANLAFHKHVVARFTLDYWQTTSEVVADYNNDVRRKQQNDGYDRFTFKIKLEDTANLEKKTMFFCVKYRVGDQEFWDNNNNINYQVDFRKKAIPQLGKNTSRNTLPRSRPVGSGGPRPVSMPTFDSYDGYGSPSSFPLSGTGRSKVKMVAPAPDLYDQEAPPARRANPSGAATFHSRYTFESALDQALGKVVEKSGKSKDPSAPRQPIAPRPQAAAPRQPIAAPANSDNPYFRMAGSNLSKNSLPRSHSSPAIPPAAGRQGQGQVQMQMQVPRLELKSPSPESRGSPLAAPRGSPMPGARGSPLPSSSLPTANGRSKPSMESSAYRELIDSYCFFGTAKHSPLVASNPAAMPEKPTTSHIEGSVNGASLSAYTYGVPTSRSPSPRPNSTQAPALSNGLHSASPLSSSQRSSRSTSPIYSHQANHSGTVGFDASLTPTAIHT